MSTSPGETNRHERNLIAFLAALSGLSALGVDLILPGLSDVRSSFGLAADSNRLSLVITVYIFGLGSGQVLYGPFADRFGRKPVLFVGLTLYGLGAVGSALSTSLPMMLVARLVMGLGAASPRAMSLTIARDHFTGDLMTRVISLTMMFFQLSPAVAPLLGEGILAVGPWQLTFVFSAIVATATMLWAFGFEETLGPDDRIPLTLERTRRTARAVFTSRWAFGHGLVLMFEFSAFYTYLSSAELIFDDVFDRGHQFAYFFAASALFQAGGNLVLSRVVTGVGTTRFMAMILVAYVTVSTAFLALTAAAGGIPSFWPWIIALWTVNTFHAMVLSTANSLAMQPLGALAGTGSGIIGTLSIVGGSVMASLVAATVRGTATPLAAAYLGFGLLAAVSLVWARGGTPEAAGATGS